jgi:hypothetical protein
MNRADANESAIAFYPCSYFDGAHFGIVQYKQYKSSEAGCKSLTTDERR